MLFPLSKLKIIRNNFFKELKAASMEKKNSLIFIKNSLPPLTLRKNKEIFQLMIFGGKVFKTALVKKMNKKLIIINQSFLHLPLFKTKEDFFSFFLSQLKKNVSLLVVNFAYPLLPKLRNGFLDGCLLQPTKEHQFSGLVGKFIGKELENFIFKKKKRKIRISLVNDVIFLLLAGLKKFHYPETLAAGIVGTGTNFSFFLNEKTAVNLESGNFNRLPQSKTGKISDFKSNNPGQQIFEKEVAGAYLFQHYNHLTKKNISSTFILTKLAKKGDLIAQRLLERSTSLIACQIAAIYLFKKEKIKNLRLKLLMEGSLFWQGWHYHNFVKKYLSLLGVGKNQIKFIRIKNSDIIEATQLLV